ncbi:MAG: HIT domain-containing protein [Thermogutta sp.]|nr:HIT domain-containing protein [Thermogutta sp.]
MERIWAPWRMSYIQSADRPSEEPFPAEKLLPGGDPGCFLCRAAADPEPPERLVITSDSLTVTVLNRYPYNNGHLLAAPRRHVGDLTEITLEEHQALMLSLSRMVELLRRVMNPDGFNVGLNLGQAAGAGLPGHLHWHIVPRWNGDTNFMPVLADVKVIPQSLEAVRDLLRASLVGDAGGASLAQDAGGPAPR